MASSPPIIFSNPRRIAIRQRMRAIHARQAATTKAARFIIDDMADDVIDRLSFTRHQMDRALLIGDWTGNLSAQLAQQGAQITRADPAPIVPEVQLDEARPFPSGGFDFIASLGLLDTVNDLPGALIHIRNALAPGGMAIASFMGAGSLPMLRQIMFAADGDRPAARLHPMVDVRAGAELLQRAGWADPVADGHGLDVSYASLAQLVHDLRAMGLGNVLAKPAPPLGKAALARAKSAFAALAGPDGRVTERFEIITLSGRRRSAPF